MPFALPRGPSPSRPPKPEPAAAAGTLTQPKASRIANEGMRGKTVVVTGGASGLGRAITLEFARQGCNVAFCFVDLPGRDMRETALLTETTVAAMGVGVFAEICDVRDRSAVGRFLYETCDRFETVHFLVNNAGVAADGALWRLDSSEWSQVIDTNLTGAFNCIATVAPIFREQHYGKIVNVSAHQSHLPGFGVASYAASKAGLEGLTRSAAVDLGPSNVNVNAVAPGFIRTDRLEALPPEVVERAEKSSILGRLAEPTDVARVVSFLCSESARHITGQVIVVDGGYSMV